MQQETLIAVVDDDSRVRESISSLLEGANYPFALFGSAEEFLGSPVLSKARCLITDVRMPGMNGIELQRRLREQRIDLPVICITAHNDEAAERRAFAEGALSLLHKPFKAAELLKWIRLALAAKDKHVGT